MTEREKIRPLSELLADLKSVLSGDTVSMDQLINALHERGVAMLLILFAAPMAMPVPVPPGINVMLATPLLLLTGHQVLGAHTIWLPRKIRRKTIQRAKMEGVIDSLVPWMRRMEVIIKPRLGFITRNMPSRFFGLLGFIMALAVCIPVPLTNTVPSLGITLMAIGFTMRDGLAVIAGALIGMAWVTMLLFAVVVFGPEAFDIIKGTIKSLI